MLLQIQKALFVSVKNTFKLWTALTYGEHGFAQNWSGWANQTIDELYDRVNQHFLLLLMSQSVEGSNWEIGLFCSALRKLLSDLDASFLAVYK
jgi:hypothetical protein